LAAIDSAADGEGAGVDGVGVTVGLGVAFGVGRGVGLGVGRGVARGPQLLTPDPLALPLEAGTR
jgi:hypothetical protein